MKLSANIRPGSLSSYAVATGKVASFSGAYYNNAVDGLRG